MVRPGHTVVCTFILVPCLSQDKFHAHKLTAVSLPQMQRLRHMAGEDGEIQPKSDRATKKWQESNSVFDIPSIAPVKTPP